jgi:hypothetical protein
MLRFAGVMVRINVAATDCVGDPESWTSNVNDAADTAAVGVPDTAPVAADNDKPAGRVPEEIDQVIGAVPPVAVSVAE